jgi:hypothetical protein
MNHTQGKWYVKGIIYPTIESRNEDSKKVITYPTIATVNHSFIAEQEYRANAKLIASAPALLEACINALKDIQNINKGLIAEGKHGYVLMETELNNAIKQATE